MKNQDDANRTPVTVLGLGLMGQALAGALLRAGHPTTVWNRTAAKAGPLVAQGARLAGSVRDAVTAGPLLIVCVSDYDAVHELLDPLDEVLEGRTLVNLTSGTSRSARETAEWAARRGVTYLDGSIMAVPEAIGTADSVLVHSGPRPAFDLYEPTLRSLGAAMYLDADHGLSSLHETAVVGLMYSTLNGFLQGAAMLGAAGVNAEAFAPIAKTATGMVVDWFAGYGRQIDDGTYPALDATLDTHLAAMENVIHESEFLGVSTDLPRFVKALADRSVSDGHGADSYAALIEQFRTSSS
ncbi:NAD(P)-dependent oxidoreductase [Streptomyces lomondensis]|uniref:3-hydroxyisobutyrate dehydrogenase n=1 Tax=Streptomyces lomondensis TaxID=68229 RepID=A0ABQ2WXB0_9ACTN|nr:NAD(P)-binding domain-containing protein [Streptomyces lomondensis]MCF0078867.1 NAD(P)-binding domain-containing protein [Streptomyces lomondensis]GGW81737.1 3-hydroxyisobutyrate dehydrogenase [Streptomyces lomondensis]